MNEQALILALKLWALARGRTTLRSPVCADAVEVLLPIIMYRKYELGNKVQNDMYIGNENTQLALESESSLLGIVLYQHQYSIQLWFTSQKSQ